VKHTGYITDIMNEMAVDFVTRPHAKPWSLWFAHKAVHPDAEQAADGTAKMEGYRVARRHEHLYRDGVFPRTPNMQAPEAFLRHKPAWAEAVELRKTPQSRAILDALMSGTQEEIRLRARMMAAVDEGVGMLFEALQRTGQLDETVILFLGDNGFFFGEHGLGPDRRFAYEEGIRSPLVIRHPARIKAGSRYRELVMLQDLAPTLIEVAGGRPGSHIQGRSLLPLVRGRKGRWRKSILIEYWAEQAYPWLVGMTYKAVRTDRYKYIRWVNRGRDGELDEMYDLARDPYEINNVIRKPAYRATRDRLRRELRRLAVEALGL
jgi:N-acetylglucosamine-6-sulfatase